MIPIHKPLIRYCDYRKEFECFRWHERPGEKCAVTGYGKTPKAAYEEYLQVKHKYETQEDW